MVSSFLPGHPSGTLRFVMKEHWASSRHYDFRLQLAGMLVSWAMPKGPSMRPGERRQAISVPLHGMGGANFEGVIRPGRYGAGPVMVWDRGIYAPLGSDVRAENPGLRTRLNVMEQQVWQGLNSGKLRFVLHGEKLNGAWSLIRDGWQSRREIWWLVKESDDFADPARDLLKENRSILTRRTMEEILRGKRDDEVDGGSGSSQPPLPNLF